MCDKPMLKPPVLDNVRDNTPCASKRRWRRYGLPNHNRETLHGLSDLGRCWNDLERLRPSPVRYHTPSFLQMHTLTICATAQMNHMCNCSSGVHTDHLCNWTRHWKVPKHACQVHVHLTLGDGHLFQAPLWSWFWSPMVFALPQRSWHTVT